MNDPLPPPYEVATSQDVDRKDVQPGRQPVPIPAASSSHPPATVYFYRDPVTQEQITSLLPPDHPEMQCLQYGHLPMTQYGLLGILAAVFWFPLGIGICMLDRKTKCKRCSQRIDDGVCG